MTRKTCPRCGGLGIKRARRNGGVVQERCDLCGGTGCVDFERVQVQGREAGHVPQNAVDGKR